MDLWFFFYFSFIITCICTCKYYEIPIISIILTSAGEKVLAFDILKI